MSQLDANSLQIVSVFNQQLSNVGPKVIPLILDFTNTDTVTVDLQLLIERGFMDFVQCVFADARNLTSEIVMTLQGSLQDIAIEPKTQGYYPVFCPNPARITFKASATGIGYVKAFLSNMPIAGVVWATS